jgi:hypothetical protein
MLTAFAPPAATLLARLQAYPYLYPYPYP